MKISFLQAATILLSALSMSLLRANTIIDVQHILNKEKIVSKQISQSEISTIREIIKEKVARKDWDDVTAIKTHVI